MMKVFISHKQEDSFTAKLLAYELHQMGASYYLDVLDPELLDDGKALTRHIRNNLNACTDVIVVMSEKTKHSQWVPFEVGMATQKDMPIATYLNENAVLPEFLEFWPRLKKVSDVTKYVMVRRQVADEYLHKGLFEARNMSPGETEKFYEVLKRKL